MRHILLAAAVTLCLITAALALPPAGEPHADLVAQSVGDRAAAAVVGTQPVERGPRVLVSPSSTSAERLALADVEDAGEEPTLRFSALRRRRKTLGRYRKPSP